MENLIFSFNATLPIFFTMLLGLFFRRIGLMDEGFVKKMNQFVFVAALLSIGLTVLLSFLLKDRSAQGEFVQASYRSSAAILGIAFIQNIYGDAGMAPLMIVGTVPLYNVMAVVVLSFMKPDRGKLDRKLLLKTLKGIVTNPILLGIAAGLAWSALRLPVPVILEKTVHNVAVLATPLGLMAMGGSLEFKKALGQIRPAVAASLIKLVGLAALFLPIAVSMGFTQEKLVAILVMLGSATTVSCFVMAKNMGHEGTLTSSAVMLTTLGSAFTLTGWLFLLRSMGLI